MASPFNVFRKHQKIILVCAGVLCMFVFVIGDVLFQLVSTGPAADARTGADDVAVRWNDGELTRQEMANLITRRNILRNFLRAVMQEGMLRSAGATPEVRPLGIIQESPQPEREMVVRHLLANAAQDVGMVVSDQAINQYLGQLAQGQVSSEELRGLVSNIQADGRRVGMNYIFEGLRDEMLAEAYLDSYGQLLQTVTPAQRWVDWRKLNDRVVVEALPLPVGNFVDKIADPTDEELRTFYETYKNRAPSTVFVQPGPTEFPSADPAFRSPRKVEIHYIEANYKNFAKGIEADVTEEDIRQYYEEHKDPQFIRPQLDLGVEGAEEPKEGMPPEPPEVGLPSATDEHGAGQASPAGTEGTAAPAAGQNETNPQPPAGSPAADSPPAEQNESEPGASANGDETSPQSPSEPQPTDNSSRGSHLFVPLDEPTEYIAYQAGATEEPPATPSDVTAAENDVAAPPTSEGAPINEGVADASPTAPSPDASAAPTGTAPSADTNPQGLPPEPPDAPVEYVPLDTVRVEIRESIARDRVEAKLLEIMPLVNSELLAVYRQYENRRLDAEEAGKDPNKVAPPQLDLQKVAAKYGLEAKQMAPMSYLELRETPLGKSEVRERSRPYWVYAFEQPTFEPTWTVGFVDFFEQVVGGMSQYIALKVDDTPARTPPLAEIRDEVVRAYKRVKARDLALAEAQRLAKEAEATDRPLKEQFAQNEQLAPVESDPFSWYARQFDSRFHLGEPYGVDHAGPDFFEAVFTLEPGKSAAVWNHDKSVAYVVRLLRHQQSEDALRNRFLIEGHRLDRFPEQLTLNALHSFQLLQALERSFLAEAGVEWLVSPDAPVDQT